MKPMVYGRRLKGRSRLGMAPLVDVVFQLLIFFLVATQVRPTEADFKQELPGRSRPHDLPALQKQRARVYLHKEASPQGVRIELAGRTVPDFATLTDRLRQADPANLLVVIDGDADIRLQHVVSALDSAMAADVAGVTFAR